MWLLRCLLVRLGEVVCVRNYSRFYTQCKMGLTVRPCAAEHGIKVKLPHSCKLCSRLFQPLFFCDPFMNRIMQNFSSNCTLGNYTETLNTSTGREILIMALFL